MIQQAKAAQVAAMEGESFQIVDMHDEIDTMWGIEHRVLTPLDIMALRQGKALYSENGEYAQLITYTEDKI